MNERMTMSLNKVSIALTELVAQLKVMANPLLQVDRAGTVHKITPSCDGALRTAVEEFLRVNHLVDAHITNNELIANVDVNVSSVMQLKEALTASPKPRDESELADAVENAMKDACNCSVCKGRNQGLQSVLDNYRRDN